MPGALSIWRLDLAWGFRRCESQATITPADTRRGEISTVIDLFYQRYPEPPANLQIVKADIFDFALTLEPESLDGIFFDPYLSKDVLHDMQQLWGDVLPALVRSLRIGAHSCLILALPELRWPYYYYFDRIIVERHSYAAYRGTEHARRSRRCVHPMLRQNTIGILAKQTKSSKLQSIPAESRRRPRRQ